MERPVLSEKQTWLRGQVTYYEFWLGSFLRSTPSDIFGYTKERKMERKLIRWYDAMVTDLLPIMTANNSGPLAKLASLPMDIRGYGPVKEAAAKHVKAQAAELLFGFRIDAAESDHS
jgi:hypothetical protein